MTADTFIEVDWLGLLINHAASEFLLNEAKGDALASIGLSEEKLRAILKKEQQ